MRICLGLLCAIGILCHRAPSPRAEGEGTQSTARPLHLMLAAGGYASVGGLASYGPNLALDLLPGSVFGRFGLRGEWRGGKGYHQGTGIVGLLYEAGASRPQLALHLLADVGLTPDREPIVGGGVETCLWLLGPVGIATMADVQLIIDGLGSRPALSFGLALQVGH